MKTSPFETPFPPETAPQSLAEKASKQSGTMRVRRCEEFLRRSNPVFFIPSQSFLSKASLSYPKKDWIASFSVKLAANLTLNSQ